MMRKSILAIAGFTAAIGAGLAIYWRWFPRAGLRWTNEEVNPWLVRRGLVGVGRSEIGTLEHVGRRSGTRHLTPVHPVPTPDGFRIVVPLADKSEWAKNVIAAGRCRLQQRDVVYELDEPALIEPRDVEGLARPIRWAEEKLGFLYLRLHTFAQEPGALGPLEVVPETPAVEAAAEVEAVGEVGEVEAVVPA